MHDARRTLMCSQSRSFWGRIVSLLLRYGVVAAQLKHVAGEAATDAREVPRGVWQDPQVARLISDLISWPAAGGAIASRHAIGLDVVPGCIGALRFR